MGIVPGEKERKRGEDREGKRTEFETKDTQHRNRQISKGIGGSVCMETSQHREEREDMFRSRLRMKQNKAKTESKLDAR